MKVLTLASALAFAVLTGACEKQPYSETRAFSHHGHGAHEAAPHGTEKPQAPATEPAKPEPAPAPSGQ